MDGTISSGNEYSNGKENSETFQYLNVLGQSDSSPFVRVSGEIKASGEST